MPNKTPRLNAKEIIVVLERLGFVCVRQNGSHKIYKNSAGKRTTVPFHAEKILHPKILKSICEDAGIAIDKLAEML